MNNDINENTLIVKHIPKTFSRGDCEEFFSFFNSKSVLYFDKAGPMQHTAIVSFESYDNAYKALFSLHERKILNSRLCVQFLKVKTNFKGDLAQASEDIFTTKNNNSNLNNNIPDWVSKLLAIAPKWGLNGPIQPKLKYNYPKANNAVLTNIVRSLVANENFYTQTLHLMNKFHFPAPFDTHLIFPGNILVVNNEDLVNSNNLKRHKDKIIETTEMDISSGNESEISDEDNQPQVKRLKLTFPKIPNNPVYKNYEFNIKPLKNVALKEIFDDKQTKCEGHIEIKVTSSIEEINDKTDKDPNYSFIEEGFGKIDNIKINNEEIAKLNTILPQLNEETRETIVDNFQLRKDKISKPSNCNVNDQYNLEPIEKPLTIILLSEIQSNIYIKSEWQNINALKNYQRGIPSNQLYVKNISKKVSKNEIISLYAAFVDWSNEVEVTSFQVKYFTEGRMKGQAFVCFNSTSIAENALELTNAFIFYDKPISVQFSKSVNS